jgi:hypothetical protein
MRAGSAMADSTVANALSEHAQFGLKPDEAAAQVRRVAKVVAGWKKRFAAQRVSAADVATLAQHIDRQFFREQRGT